MINNTSSYRTLIECINYFISKCPVNGTIDIKINSNNINLTLFRAGKVLFEIKDCPNLQIAYEELLIWIIEKSDIQNR